jgi:hypothetical protein
MGKVVKVGKVRKVDTDARIFVKYPPSVRKIHRSSSGKSLAVTLPARICKELKITRNTFLRIARKKEKIILEKVKV